MKRWLLSAVMAGALTTGAANAAQAWWGPEHVAHHDHHHGRPVFADNCRHDVVVLRQPAFYAPRVIAAPVPVEAYYQPYYQPGFVSIAGRNFAFQFGF